MRQGRVENPTILPSDFWSKCSSGCNISYVKTSTWHSAKSKVPRSGLVMRFPWGVFWVILSLIRVRHQNFRFLKFGHFPTHARNVSWFLDMCSIKKGIEEEEEKEDRGKSYDNNANFDMEKQEDDWQWLVPLMSYDILSCGYLVFPFCI